MRENRLFLCLLIEKYKNYDIICTIQECFKVCHTDMKKKNMNNKGEADYGSKISNFCKLNI